MATIFSGYFLLKLVLTAAIVAGVSELSKHDSYFAAFLASLPLTSLLAFIWMHVEGQSNEAVAALSNQIFWLVIPSLLFFVVFPWLLRINFAFAPALVLAAAATALAYILMNWVQGKMGANT